MQVPNLLEPEHSHATNSAKKTGVGFTVAASPKAQVASTATSTTSTGNSVITASDFITLLVTELKNQDPTSNQDPNAYINQLVSVNSLQQLISINQDLSSSGTSSSASSAPAGQFAK